MSFNEFGINPLCCISLPGYAWQCGFKYTEINLKTLQDKDLILTLESNLRGGKRSDMEDRYVKSDENKKMLYFDAINLYGHWMSQTVPYDEIQMWNGHLDPYMNKLEGIINIRDDSNIGYFVGVYLRYPDNIKEKTNNFLFCPEKTNFLKINIMFYWEIKTKNYTKLKN